MSGALILVTVLIGSFVYWQARKALDEEIRGRALYVAKDLAALTVDDIITGNKSEIYKKISAPFIANEDTHTGSDLLYIMIYKQNLDLLIGSSASEVFFNSESYFYTVPMGASNVKDEVNLAFNAAQLNKPLFRLKKTGIYDLIVPVVSGSQNVGYVRIGISGQRYTEKFYGIMKKAVLPLIVILIVGLAFSQAIAVGITKPILKLSDAAQKLSRQNWDLPLPVKGRDEISKLSQAFNQMALTLKQRELSLSRGNKDLFILHTAGLDLMENLDLDGLLVKIAARSEDLIRAETTCITMVDATAGRMLRYLAVFGPKADTLKAMAVPLEAAGIYNWLACYGTPLLIPEAQADFRLDTAQMESLGVTSIMTIPLWSSNRMTGLLTAVNKKGGARFDRQDLRLFTVFSNLAGAALQNASLYTDLIGKMNELRTAQEQLIHSTKMAAIGELAANVAHEVNNPLTSVLGYTTHLLKTLELPESSRRILSMMEQETLRVRKIIRNLLDFSRQKTSWMQPADLQIPLRETTAFLRGAAESSGVRILEEYDDSPVIINMDANEMKQVFINLINNAIQAMPSGGELTVGLTTVDQEAIIQFMDTGIGITEENIKKIFEPFFSTKESGDGTGLGLSISYRIVQNHGGRIEVSSRPGKETIFKVFLPLLSNSPALQKR